MMMTTTTVLVALALGAAPVSTYDRLSDTTLVIEKVMGMDFLIPVGTELEVVAYGNKRNDKVKTATLRFWQTLSERSAPSGIIAEKTVLKGGDLVVDGKRAGDIWCDLPAAPTPVGNFTTWSKELPLNGENVRAIAAARSKIEVRCQRTVKVIEGDTLKALLVVARQFARARFDTDPARERASVSKQDDDDDAPRSVRSRKDDDDDDGPPRSAAIATLKAGASGEMAALRARKLVGVADCIATELEDNAAATTETVKKKCKGYIDVDGNLVTVR